MTQPLESIEALSQRWVPGPVAYAVLSTMAALLAMIIVVMMVYATRHGVLTLNRLLGHQRHPYLDIDQADWPLITVFIAAHNEEQVIAGCLQALLDTNYPLDRLKVVPVNDRSTDGTRAIIDDWVGRYLGESCRFTVPRASQARPQRSRMPCSMRRATL